MKHSLDYTTGFHKTDISKQILNSLGSVPFLRNFYSQIARKFTPPKSSTGNPYTDGTTTLKEKIFNELNYDNLTILLATLVAIYGIINLITSGV